MGNESSLVIEDLHVSVDDKEILTGVDLVVEPGKVHALMGPNGSGKSTLAYALAGHPRYEVTRGRVSFAGENVLELTPDERARLGMFLAMQYPVEVPGVSVTNFLRTAVAAVRGEDVPVRQFAKELREQMKLLGMDTRFAERHLNEGFSGGEKKRHEILQMALLKPKLAILDETDSGLDVDALRVVADGVNRLRSPGLGVLLITHYTRILRYIKADVVHVMMDGRVVRTGGSELADQLEEHGYEPLRTAAAGV
jgi:Fe-S cluster assembly ATP-binding protein